MSDFYYVGGDLKVAVAFEATGFDMVRDDWEVSLKVGNSVLKTYQKAEVSMDESGTWFIPVVAEDLKPGAIDVVFRAHVPDTDFQNGYRRDVDKKKLTDYKKI